MWELTALHGSNDAERRQWDLPGNYFRAENEKAWENITAMSNRSSRVTQRPHHFTAFLPPAAPGEVLAQASPRAPGMDGSGVWILGMLLPPASPPPSTAPRNRGQPSG